MASERNKKYAIIGVSSIVLVAVVVALIASIGWEDGNSKEISASQRSIKNVCQSTDYQQTCVESLTSAAGNVTDPQDLVKIAFELAIKKIQEAANHSSTLQEIHKDPRTNEALKNCQELAHLAIKDLERSFNKMQDLDLSQFDDVLTKLKIWLSGAMTYEETCLDGFEETVGDAGDKMRDALKTAMELTTNSLAMIDEISLALESLSIQNPTVTNRRLLSSSKQCHTSLLDNIYCYLAHHIEAPHIIRRLVEDKPAEIKPNLTVAKDGTGNFTSINEALYHIPKNSNETFILYIKEGVYDEHVQFNSSLTHLMVVGDGPTKTRITGSLNYKDGITTFHTATVAVLGDYFIAKDIGFENTAGPEKHQAVALRVGADMSIFHNCHMDGYQDTLYAHTYRQYYRDCKISGTIDFIFGDAAAVFQNCTMVVRKPMDNQQNIVTAQGRKNARQPTGIVLQNCTIEAEPALYPVRNKTKSYLGRPWKEFSRTIIMESYIGDLIQPQGWLPWNATFALETLFYTEFNNRGPSSPKEKRVNWTGIKELPMERIMRFTAAEFIEGDQWILETGVPYVSGLIYPPPKENATAISEYTPEEDKDVLGSKKNKTTYYQKPASPSVVASNTNGSPSSAGTGTSTGTSTSGSASPSSSTSTSASPSSSTSASSSSSTSTSASTSTETSTSTSPSSSSSTSTSASPSSSTSTSASASSSSSASTSTKTSTGTSTSTSTETNTGTGTSTDTSTGTSGTGNAAAAEAAPESFIAASPADAPALSPDASPSELEGSWTFNLFG